MLSASHMCPEVKAYSSLVTLRLLYTSSPGGPLEGVPRGTVTFPGHGVPGGLQIM